MKKFFIIISFLLILFLVLYAGLFFFINTKGKDILSAKVESELGLKPEIENVSLRFPFILEISNFSLENIFFARAEVSIGGFNPLTSSLKINRFYLEQPDIKITKKGKEFFIGPLNLQEFFTKGVSAEQRKDAEDFVSGGMEKKEPVEKEGFYIEVKKFYLNNGKINYKEKKGDDLVELTFFGINLEVENFSYPGWEKVFFDLSSSLKAENEIAEDVISLSGWIDYDKKDMDADLKIDFVNYKMFSGYYPPRVQPERLGIKKAFLSSETNFKAENNELTVNSVLILDKIDFVEIEDQDDPRLSGQRLARRVINFLKDEQGKAKIFFKLKTKMDSPQINFDSLGESLRKSFLSVSGKLNGQTINSVSGVLKEGKRKAIQIPKKTIDEVTGAMQDALDLFKDVFKGALKE